VTDESTEPLAGTGVDPTVPHTARIWNYWLGGKDNYAVDREAGDAVIAVYPQAVRRGRTEAVALAV
jgi:class 3 adenylate cyclase